ncbi:hypothetical protein [Desulfosediminicola flagellatus]|uniref:hypothetical protein n=1 Tax=Desulfosediminicola flagellatus TaxID=2569541 RepID=UPI0010AC0D56|nr:hypothetical protein [Desulfosediminicola flagellatus]
MGVVHCCKQIFKRYSDQHRAVICKNWVMPLRAITVTSLFAHMAWRAYHPALFYTFAIIIIHSLVALLILAECKRSDRYHKTIEDFERREAAYRNSSTH